MLSEVGLRKPDVAYSAFEHLRRALFLRGKSLMGMFTVYMDETGHKDDPGQKVVGMAGFINSVENWDLFDAKWKEALKKAEVPHFKNNLEPYFHMREFKWSRDTFETWKGQRIRQDKLYDKLLRIIESTHAVPFGSLITIDIWSHLTKAQQQRFLDDPDCFCAAECAFSILRLIHGRPADETVKVVFSEKEGVKARIRRIFDQIRTYPEFTDRISDPIFENMRKLPALQAADVIAWEMNAEYRRLLYAPEKPQSEAYKRLEKQKNRRVTGPHEILQFHRDEYVRSLAKEVEDKILRFKRALTGQIGD